MKNLITKLKKAFIRNRKNKKDINNLKERYKSKYPLSSSEYIKYKKWFHIYENYKKNQNLKSENYDDDINTYCLLHLTKILFHLSLFFLNRYDEKFQDLEEIFSNYSEDNLFSKKQLNELKEIRNNYFFKPREIANKNKILLKREIKMHLIIAFTNQIIEEGDINDLNRRISDLITNKNELNNEININFIFNEKMVNLIMDIMEELTNLKHADIINLIKRDLGEGRRDLWIPAIKKIYPLIEKKIILEKEYKKSPSFIRERVIKILENIDKKMKSNVHNTIFLEELREEIEKAIKIKEEMEKKRKMEKNYHELCHTSDHDYMLSDFING